MSPHDLRLGQRDTQTTTVLVILLIGGFSLPGGSAALVQALLKAPGPAVALQQPIAEAPGMHDF